ncbi:MAG: ectonucleotide pyrophosphatase/phosphodiesterase [Gemmatimonadaceae bacterium]|jgi:predicted AlkP superfamily pyrophosphatase or phosphodiesterase
MRLLVLLCGALLCVSPAEAQRSAPRVLLIGLDGFRADYLERPAAVHLRTLAARGVRAERMIPAFPSKTFPNHYSIVTGLTPEHHGIVANAMRDSVLGLFRLSDRSAVQTSAWWGGEPIWVTAERQGRRAATYFWPGSEAAIGGVRPSWWDPYDGNRPNAERERQVLEWLALPADSAPAFIALYFSDTDDAGHRHGPDAPQVDSAIARVDSAVGRLVAGIARLGLTDQVNIIVVADHGMAAVAPERTIVLDDYLDLTTVEIVDLNPVAMISPRDGDVDRVMRALQGRHPHLHVYRRGETPLAFRFRAHPRITPIVAIADDGWSIVARGPRTREGAVGAVRGGAHGYDPQLPSMAALFIAAGPGIAQGRTVPAFQNIHVYPLMAELLRLRPAPTDGALDSVRTILRTRGASSP